VQCLFCVHFGKEDHRGEGIKRQRMANIMIWKVFRPELYQSHHTTQHTSSWSDYMRLTN
jgi:hypothetical protein